MKFNIGDEVRVILTDQVGWVIGRAEYNNVYPTSYWVQYESGEGNLAKSWFDEQDLTYPLIRTDTLPVR
jgi:hypothetical protein